MKRDLDTRRLDWEQVALFDEFAEEIRLGNISPCDMGRITRLMYEKHDEAIEALNDSDANVEDIIRIYRELVRNSFKF